VPVEGLKDEMADDDPMVGTICWRDLTVRDAKDLAEFYRQVVGWETRAEDMDGYEDFHMIPPGTGESVAGICHARGTNADLPPQWLVYIAVEDVDESVRKALALGGKVVAGPRALGSGRFCVIRDPAGAVCALYAP
jgi:predicted enzyme related to lactoylglutathione lyase